MAAIGGAGGLNTNRLGRIGDDLTPCAPPKVGQAAR